MTVKLQKTRYLKKGTRLFVFIYIYNDFIISN